MADQNEAVLTQEQQAEKVLELNLAEYRKWQAEHTVLWANVPNFLKDDVLPQLREQLRKDIKDHAARDLYSWLFKCQQNMRGFKSRLPLLKKEIGAKLKRAVEFQGCRKGVKRFEMPLELWERALELDPRMKRVRLHKSDLRNWKDASTTTLVRVWVSRPGYAPGDELDPAEEVARLREEVEAELAEKDRDESLGQQIKAVCDGTALQIGRGYEAVGKGINEGIATIGDFLGDALEKARPKK